LRQKWYFNKGEFMEPIKIQRVQKEDLEEVARIRVEGWKIAYRGIIDDGFLDQMLSIEKDRKKREKDYMLNGFLVAKRGDKVVGFCRYISDNSFSPDMAEIDCEITALYVAPECKQQGIGTALFSAVKAEFQEQHKTKMVIWCLKENLSAHQFYKKMGGKMQGEKQSLIGDRTYPEVCFVYEL